MGGIFDALGELVGTVVGGVAGLAVNGVNALGEFVEHNGIYVKCPYCRKDIKVLKYRCIPNDDGRRQCSECSKYFFVD